MSEWGNQKWSNFLTEAKDKAKKELVQEINWKKDKSELLRDNDRFSVSFEIELESDGRGEKTLNHSRYKSAQNRESKVQILNYIEKRSPGAKPIDFILNAFMNKTSEWSRSSAVGIWPRRGIELRNWWEAYADKGFDIDTHALTVEAAKHLRDRDDSHSLADVENSILSALPENDEDYTEIDEILLAYSTFVRSKMREVANRHLHTWNSFNDGAHLMKNLQIPIDEYWPDFVEWDARAREEYSTGVTKKNCSKRSLKIAMEEHLPKFMTKYKPNLKFEKDGSLKCGIEFSWDNPPYMTGLRESVEYLEDFFEEFDKQSFFRFDKSTGLHTNIGYLDESGDPVENYNLFKALMFLNHEYATTGVGFPGREDSRYSGDLKNPALLAIKQALGGRHHKELMDLFKKKDFDKLSKEFSRAVRTVASAKGAKRIGFNVAYTSSRRYIEFRFPGHVVNLESMKKALFYYAFIVKASADPEFKKKEYQSDLVGFISDATSKSKSHPKSRLNLKRQRDRRRERTAEADPTQWRRNLQEKKK